MRGFGAFFVLGLAALAGCGDVIAPPAPAPDRVEQRAMETPAPRPMVERAEPNAPHQLEKPRKAESKSAPSNKIPAYAIETLKYVRERERAPDGFEGGRNFGNYERLLPQREKGGKAIKYREWDVKPRVQGRNRGAERLVTGSDGSAWYTSDHYKSFLPVE